MFCLAISGSCLLQITSSFLLMVDACTPDKSMMKQYTCKMLFVLLLCTVMCKPVVSQGFFGQAGSAFPSIATSLQLPRGSSAFSPAPAFKPLELGPSLNQRPFLTFQNSQPSTQQDLKPSKPSDSGATQGGHTYPDGTTGGDYPSKMAEKAKATAGGHTYPDGTTGGDYPSRMAEKAKATAGGHTYPDGTMGGDYPSKMAEKAKATAGGHTYPDGTTGGDYPSKMAEKAKATAGGHTYPDGTTGGDYPSKMAEKAKAGATQRGHTYPDGTTGGDYPSKMADQQVRFQQQQQPQFSTGQFQNNVPFQFPAQKSGNPSFTNSFQSTRPGQSTGTHVYPNGQTGGDYPSHLKAQQTQNPGQVAFSSGLPNQQSQGSTQHVYPNGQTGGDYPSHLKAQQTQNPGQVVFSSGQTGGNFRNQLPTQQAQGSTQHVYPNGQTGGDYPSHLKAQQTQNPGQVVFSSGQTGWNFRNQLPTQQAQGSTQHVYPNGQTGGDYPSHLKAQQTQNPGQVVFSSGQTGGNFRNQLPTQQAQGSTQHVYPNGQTGGDYPSHLKAQQTQNPGQVVFSSGQTGGNFRNQLPTQQAQGSSQHVYPNGQTGGDYPSHLKAQQTQNPGQVVFSTGQNAGNFPSQLPTQQAQGSTQHVYPNGQTGGDYPSHLKAQQQSGSSQFLPPKDSANTFRSEQVFPPESAQNQLFSQTRRQPDPRGVFQNTQQPRVSVQKAPNTDFALSASVPRNSFDTFSRGSVGSSIFQPAAGQCFQYQDMAASYELSDVINDYPMDAIMLELRTKQHLASMVGYELLPAPKSSSPFDTFDSGLSSSLSSFGFQEPATKLSNTKHFPANFDENTLGQAMKTSVKVCPSQRFTLRALSVDNKRCVVVNADYQDISYTKCTRRDCNVCRTSQNEGGVSACVEHYNWVSVMVFCRHWQRTQRVQMRRLYLPQSCTCNKYQC